MWCDVKEVLTSISNCCWLQNVDVERDLLCKLLVQGWIPLEVNSASLKRSVCCEDL